jgi:hypothetical protein
MAGVMLFGAAQVVIVVSGLADGDLLADDAFYYFQIARQASLGRGLSFDGLYPTNGFHPLFASLCVPLFAMAGQSMWWPIHAALALLGVCAAATGWAIFQLGRLTHSELTGERMALFFLASPFAWLLPLRGTEEALATLLLMCSAVQVARIDRAPTTRGALSLGLLLGGAMLARTEYVLWALPVCVWLLWRTRNASVLGCGGVACAVLAPWLAWNLVRFGTIFQVSGAVKTSIDIFGRFPSSGEPLGFLSNILLPFERSARFSVGEEFASPQAAWVLLVVEGILVLVALVAGGRRRVPAPLALLYVFAALHLAFYGYVMRHYFVWYFLPVAAVMACFLGDRLVAVGRRGFVGLASLSVVTCFAVLATFFARMDCQPRSAELRMARLTRVLAAVPAGSRIGRWNAGAYGYFAGFLHPDLHVVNLDGLVNNELFAAYQRGEYAAWLLREVNYLAEEPEYLLLYMDERAAQDLMSRHASYVSRDPLLIRLAP